MAVSWGSVPEWLEALGTIAAFIGALWLLRIELNRRNEEVQDRRVAQAKLVVAWVEQALNEKDDEADYVIRVVNQSDLPATMSYLIEWPNHSPGRHYVAGTLPPKYAGTKTVRYAAYPQVDHFEYQRAWNSGLPGLTVYIGDSSGRHWIRDVHGNLTENVMRTPRDEALDVLGVVD